MTNENAPAVAEICHRLDGLPLALELAAARLRLLTPEKLLAHLGQRLRILSGGARDLPARQQTLRSAIDWSYNLLSHTEQVLFQSLAVFPASFTYEAAEAVCPVPETGNLIELLDQLIEKSLLKLVEEESDLRFVMLETLREYALEKLAEDHGASYSMSQRHLGYFQDWAEALRPQLFQRQMPACLDQIELDYPNLQAALDWALEHDPGTGLRLCSALYKFWSIRIEYRKEGTHWFEKFLAISAAGESPVPQQAADRAWGLLHASRLTFEAGLKNPAREAWLDECVRWSLENSDHACAAEALALRGHSWILSDEASARLVLEQGLAEARLANSDLALGMIYHHLGVLGFYRGDAEESIHQTFETSLALAKKCGDFSIWLHSIYMLGILNAVKGEWQAAIQCHQEGLALAQEIGDPVSTATALSELGNLAMGLGDFEQAQTLLLQAHELLEDTPDDFGFTTVQGTLGELARWQGNYTQAITYLLGMRHKVSDPGSRINYICVLADAERRLNHIEAARRVLLDALDETQKLNQPWIIDTILIPFIAYFSFGLKNHAAAVLLLSWSEHANQSPNRFPSYQREFDEIDAQARAQLDETALASAQQAALELTVEQVLVYAQTLLRTV